MTGMNGRCAAKLEMDGVADNALQDSGVCVRPADVGTDNSLPDQQTPRRAPRLRPCVFALH